MYKQTDTTILHFIMIVFIVFKALKTLLQSPGICLIKKPKILPKKKTSTQLKKMLKKELIDLVVAYQ